MAFTESVPAADHVPDFLEHVLGEYVRIGTAPAILEPLEFADQMGPAEMPLRPFL